MCLMTTINKNFCRVETIFIDYLRTTSNKIAHSGYIRNPTALIVASVCLLAYRPPIKLFGRNMLFDQYLQNICLIETIFGQNQTKSLTVDTYATPLLLP